MSLMIHKNDIRNFLLSGNAVVTISNRLTQNRFTYKVKQKRDGNIFWVSLLNGPDNTQDYRFFGTIYPTSGPDRMIKPVVFKHSNKGKIGDNAPAAVAWTWFFNRLFSPHDFPLQFEVYHSGACGRCGRRLTTPESLRIGLGPECAEHVLGFSL